MLCFARNMELCQVLPKIWNYFKFCQKYEIILNFAKNMELFEILPNLLNYVKFCQKC